MYKHNKNKLYYKSDLITTSVQRLNSTLEWRRYSDVGTTLYLGCRRRNLYPTYIQRWSNAMCLLGSSCFTFDVSHSLLTILIIFDSSVICVGRNVLFKLLYLSSSHLCTVSRTEGYRVHGEMLVYYVVMCVRFFKLHSANPCKISLFQDIRPIIPYTEP